MKLVRMSDPRPGQQVQCVKCHKMIGAADALADIQGKAGDFYHSFCVPPGTTLPGLTPAMVRSAKTTYATPRLWDAYLDLAPKGHEGKVTDREVLTVRGRSRDEAFDRLRDEEVQYNRTHPKVSTVGRGVAHAPRLSR